MIVISGRAMERGCLKQLGWPLPQTTRGPQVAFRSLAPESLTVTLLVYR
jgi:hypothetical protein